MKDLDPEVKAGIKAQYLELLNARINALILAEIPESRLDDFERMLESGDPRRIQDFCEGNVPGLSDLVAQALVDFKLKYVGA